ncbi:hypothetical protein RHMOL_Rhmol13G0287300 [Rhododendron molle]|uniref:Uncharacterized protein n=2 Tax=Rhododendron molle TaxID=49168 RepID=A0ACC0LCS6_RHOML|nr:hypothetical protein RHMOL_Rhmol13G0287300 [Rhododendron molle]KAI8526158.1 hypothetical protein RHMOL_Rhmol13G0287300 [Rhododendron molle]
MMPKLNCLQTSLCITLAIYAVAFFTQPYYPASESFFSPFQSILSPSQTTPPPPRDHNSPTNINHLVFGLVGSLKAWRHRKAYIESWWRPNVTRGYLYLDTAPTEELLPWSAASPPLRVSDDISKIVEESGHVAPIMVRMVHAILEVCREGDQGVRWYVMGDDDSIFFVDNWVDVLAKYDHTKYIYIGGHSETLLSNFHYSFDQGFGGAGFALSYPLASAMVKDLEGCLKRYPHLNSADLITQYCVDELGVSLSVERGIHQILPRSILKRPRETFKAWMKGTAPLYMFNSREPPFGDPCDDPHVFFLETVESSRGNLIVSTYARSSPRGLPTCFFSGNHSADQISKVRVLSPSTKLIERPSRLLLLLLLSLLQHQVCTILCSVSISLSVYVWMNITNCNEVFPLIAMGLNLFPTGNYNWRFPS